MVDDADRADDGPDEGHPSNCVASRKTPRSPSRDMDWTKKEGRHNSKPHFQCIWVMAKILHPLRHYEDDNDKDLARV